MEEEGEKKTDCDPNGAAGEKTDDSYHCPSFCCNSFFFHYLGSVS